MGIPEFLAHLKSYRLNRINLSPCHVDMPGGDLVYMLNFVRHDKSVTAFGVEQGEQISVQLSDLHRGLVWFGLVCGLFCGFAGGLELS
jgi:hypothetical protein